MSEQYPLLCEDFSDDDKFSPRFQRRRLMNLRGRAKNHIKGAANIMTRWPEHWTSVLTYWWIGLGMIALTTFIIYNTLFSIAVLQPTNIRPTKYASFKTITYTTKPSPPPSVFMHVFVNDNVEDLNKYLPYIEVFANKYKEFTYNLIVVANDTNSKTNNLSDERNNNIALNSLWANDVNYGDLASSHNNINVIYVALTKYLNDSPMKKHWNDLPHQFIPFIVRAISVWDKGGIAINPIILTPQSPHVSYVEKFVSIIKQFKKSKTKMIIKEAHEIPVKKHNKISPKFNNIQDIINALDSGESSDDPDKEILHSVETRNSLTVANIDNKSMSLTRQDLSEKQTNYSSTKVQEPTMVNSNIQTTEAPNQVQNAVNEEDRSNHSSLMLPLFLEYLFQNKKSNSSYNATSLIKKRRSLKATELAKVNDGSDLVMGNLWNAIKSTDSYKPMIVSAKGISNNSTTNYSKPTYQNDEPLFELTIDLKGNMIATETPCHAFIGNMFTNAMHHDVSESLTDFIIKELSVFCKGLLATCVGIDVILV